MGYPIRKKLNLLKSARKELLKRAKQGIDVEYLLKDVDKKIMYYEVSLFETTQHNIMVRVDEKA